MTQFVVKRSKAFIQMEIATLLNRKLETYMQQFMKAKVFEKEKINLAWQDSHTTLKII